MYSKRKNGCGRIDDRTKEKPLLPEAKQHMKAYKSKTAADAK